MEYLGARKFQDWTCCTGGILPQYHAGIQWAPKSELFFHKCLKKQSACLGACFYAPVAIEVIGTPDFNYLDGRVNTFGNIVYLLDASICFMTLSTSWIRCHATPDEEVTKSLTRILHCEAGLCCCSTCEQCRLQHDGPNLLVLQYLHMWGRQRHCLYNACWPAWIHQDAGWW